MSNIDEVTTIGAQLAQARQTLGRSLSSISEELCIRVRHLEALEANDFANLPATPFAIGYVRSYARLLGMDPDKLADQFRAQCGATEARAELNFPEPIHESRFPSRAAMATAAAALFGIYFGWFYGTGDAGLGADVSPVPGHLLAEAENALAAPGTNSEYPVSTRSGTEPAVAQAGVDDKPVIDVPDGIGTDSLLALAEPTETPTTEGDADVAVASAVPVQSPAGQAEDKAEPTSNAFLRVVSLDLFGSATAAPAHDATEGRVLLRAASDAWILITDAQGADIFKGVLRKGQQYTVPDLDGGAQMMTSNAGGLEIYVDGDAMRPLGKRGAVLRGIDLEPDRLKRGRSVAMR